MTLLPHYHSKVPFGLLSQPKTIVTRLVTMSVTISTQQSDWNSNAYVVTVTRVLLGVGIFYLVRSIVQLVQWSCSPVPSRQINGEQSNTTWPLLCLHC